MMTVIVLMISAVGLSLLQLLGGVDGSVPVYSRNLSCNTFRDHLYNTEEIIPYDRILQYYEDYWHIDFDELVYYATNSELVQYFLHKILEDDSSDDHGILSLQQAFKDNAEEKVHITYYITVPCKERNEVIKSQITYTENEVFPGILKGMEETNIRLERIDIEMTAVDGFNEDCEKLLCGRRNNVHDSYRDISGDDLEGTFCEVTNLLYLQWKYIDNYAGYGKIADNLEFGHQNCFADWYIYFSIQIWQYIFFEAAMGLFHMIIFLLLVKYRLKFHDYISAQTQGNKVRSLLFWSLIVSIILLFIYTVVIVLFAVTNRRVTDSEAYITFKTVNDYFDFLGILVSSSFFVLFSLLHLPVVFCCMCSCTKKRSSTALCIPGTCFSRFPVCSYPFQSFAFYVINIIPHLVLFLISILALQFSSAPLPSVTALFYFVLLLFGNIIFNALSINLITAVCKDSKCLRRCFCRSLSFIFGFIVAIATNIMTVIVVISLVDYLLNTTEQSSYSAILPGVIITVGGWYFSGDIAKYTGIDLSIDGNSKTDDADAENVIASYEIEKGAMELRNSGNSSVTFY